MLHLLRYRLHWAFWSITNLRPAYVSTELRFAELEDTLRHNPKAGPARAACHSGHVGAYPGPAENCESSRGRASSEHASRQADQAGEHGVSGLSGARGLGHCLPIADMLQLLHFCWAQKRSLATLH